MVEVKVRKMVEKISVPGLMGMESYQPHSYLQLYDLKSGRVLPDGVYVLKQGDRQEVCSVTAGQVRGSEWIDGDKPIFSV